MKTILVPTDFSKNAANAVDFAISLVHLVKGRLLLMHTVEVPAVGLLEGMAMLPAEPGLVEACEEELQKQTLAIREAHGHLFEVETFCLFGGLVPQLNELVRTQAVDLVVMGTHGATNCLDRLVGTNTATFLKATHCPVLAIPEKARFNSLQKIAFATDLESEETVFLKQLFQFAAPFGSDIHFVHVNLKAEPTAHFPSLQTISRHYPHTGYQVFQLPGQDVAKSLRSFVTEKAIHLLAIPVHGQNFWNQLFHTSVPEKLAQQAFIPLLALPEEPYQTVPSSWSGKLKTHLVW